MPPNRITSIDTLRVLAIFAVICIHTQPFKDISPDVWGYFNQVTAFAVPFFFIVSGYLFTSKVDSGTVSLWDIYWRYMKRLAVVFAAWTIIYFLVPAFGSPSAHDYQHAFSANFDSQLETLVNDPVAFLTRGTKPLLWYISALMVDLTVLAIFMRLKIRYAIVALAVPAYVIVLLTGYYVHSSLGFDIGITIDNGLGVLIGLMYVAIGMALASTGYVPSARTAITVLVAGLFLELAEFGIANHLLETEVTRRALLSTAVYATGFMLLALARPGLGSRTWLPTWGRYTVGVYVSQAFFILLIGQIAAGVASAAVWQPVYPILVYLAGLSMSAVLAKVALTRYIVT